MAKRLTGPGSDLLFHRSSYCDSGDCVEVAQRRDGMVSVRDSKNRAQQELIFTREEWVAFMRGAKSGEFDFGMNIGAGIDSMTVRLSR